MSYRKVIRLAIVALFLIALGVAWYYWQHTASTTQSLLSQKPLPTLVQVAKVVSKPLPQRLQALGVLEANQLTHISADIGGKVTATLYQPGSYVTRGTPLIQLDDRTYRTRLQADEAALALARVNYQRYRSLTQWGAQAKQTLDQAKADFIQAETKVRDDQTRLDQTTLTAPFSGYVGAKTVNVGDYVNPGQSLTVLVDRQQLQVSYQFPETSLSRLQLGQTVTLEPTNGTTVQSHQHYMGKVTYLAPQVDTSTHSITLQATLPNPQNALAPGLFVRVYQEIGEPQETLVIPEESLIPTITGNQVYVVKNNKAYAVPVTTGITINGQVQIVKGLKVGDTVIVAGQQQLKNGAPVQEGPSL
ncbi:MAG: hypothetical protein A3F17_06705 [Gammaproteobacteria bacterium RIFCSPHIGHO2_12_FULL_41_15]|nr:MAG: hypothetical protein A3F17_06705 [Gammaproteobacteria bacterium RIFCSPHIGHO2_12_FULL_41_15]